MCDQQQLPWKPAQLQRGVVCVSLQMVCQQVLCKKGYLQMELNCGGGRTLPGTFSKEEGEHRHQVLMNALFSSLFSVCLNHLPAVVTGLKNKKNQTRFIGFQFSSPSAVLTKTYFCSLTLHICSCLTTRTDSDCFERQAPHNKLNPQQHLTVHKHKFLSFLTPFADYKHCFSLGQIKK